MTDFKVGDVVKRRQGTFTPPWADAIGNWGLRLNESRLYTFRVEKVSPYLLALSYEGITATQRFDLANFLPAEGVKRLTLTDYLDN